MSDTTPEKVRALLRQVRARTERVYGPKLVPAMIIVLVIAILVQVLSGAAFYYTFWPLVVVAFVVVRFVRQRPLYQRSYHGT
jgi:flagellar biosynthesis protein FliQ